MREEITQARTALATSIDWHRALIHLDEARRFERLLEEQWWWLSDKALALCAALDEEDTHALHG